MELSIKKANEKQLFKHQLEKKKEEQIFKQKNDYFKSIRVVFLVLAIIGGFGQKRWFFLNFYWNLNSFSIIEEEEEKEKIYFF